MSVRTPKTCVHGVGFGRDDKCAGCSIVWHESLLATALAAVERHAERLAHYRALTPSQEPEHE